MSVLKKVHDCSTMYGWLHIGIVSVNLNTMSGRECEKMGSWVPKGYKCMSSPERLRAEKHWADACCHSNDYCVFILYAAAGPKSEFIKQNLSCSFIV